MQCLFFGGEITILNILRLRSGYYQRKDYIYFLRLSRPTGRDKQFFHNKNRPRDTQKHLSVLNYSLLVFLAVAHKLFQFIKEAFHICKLAVDRGKADIGHLVDLFQLLHGQLADAHAGDLAVVGTEQGLLDAADSTFQRLTASAGQRARGSYPF